MKNFLVQLHNRPLRNINVKEYLKSSKSVLQHQIQGIKFYFNQNQKSKFFVLLLTFEKERRKRKKEKYLQESQFWLPLTAVNIIINEKFLPPSVYLSNILESNFNKAPFDFSCSFNLSTFQAEENYNFYILSLTE